MNQLSFLASDGSIARQERDAGMPRALEHAESDTPGWGDKAYAFLAQYALEHDRFPGWFVHREAEAAGCVPVASGKAWGSVLSRGARAGIIAKDGFIADVNRKMNPCPVWRSLIYKP